MKTYKVAFLPGDGIGPEVCQEAVKILKMTAKLMDFKIEFISANVGGIAIDEQGKALPEETIKICEESQAILFGAVGGPKWEKLSPEEQPERAALLPLRKYFNLFANFRPALIYPSLIDSSPLKNNLLKGGLDILILRELTGGIYFGTPKLKTEEEGLDTLRYKKEEVERIAHLAFKTARLRKSKVTSIDKANVLSSMVFWREVVTSVSKEYLDVSLEHMYVDNAAMQLVRDPNQFDVLLCPNMFGDILSDEASMVTGSIGMLPSASLSSDGFGLYEPISGSAPDIAGKNLANPIAQIVSAAMLLEYSFKEKEAGTLIRKAVSRALEKGYRTRDIMREGQQEVSTKEMGNVICEELVRSN